MLSVGSSSHFSNDTLLPFGEALFKASTLAIDRSLSDDSEPDLEELAYNKSDPARLEVYTFA